MSAQEFKLVASSNPYECEHPYANCDYAGGPVKCDSCGDEWTLDEWELWLVREREREEAEYDFYWFGRIELEARDGW